MSTQTRRSTYQLPRVELSGLSAPAVWRLTAAVHVALVLSLVLLVTMRQLGLHVGLASEVGVNGLLLLTAVLVAARRGRVSRR